MPGKLEPYLQQLKWFVIVVCLFDAKIYVEDFLGFSAFPHSQGLKIYTHRELRPSQIFAWSTDFLTRLY